MNQAQWMMNSRVGPLHLVASEKGLTGLFWKKRSAPSVESLKGTAPEIKILALTVRQLEEYFAGKRKEFDVPLYVEGTEFQKRVWDQLCKIPYGETVSYQDIARKIKNDRAVRAVGTANGRNPISIIVPCHRVIAASGKLGGYAGGLDIKTKLLGLERGQLHL